MAKAKAMTKPGIVKYLSEQFEISKTLAEQILEGFVALAYAEAKTGFNIPGLGKLIIVNRKARMGRNPATGEAIKIPAKKALKFRVSKVAKEAVL